MLKRHRLYRDEKDSVYEEWVYRDKKAEEQKAESIHIYIQYIYYALYTHTHNSKGN